MDGQLGNVGQSKHPKISVGQVRNPVRHAAVHFFESSCHSTVSLQTPKTPSFGTCCACRGIVATQTRCPPYAKEKNQKESACYLLSAVQHNSWLSVGSWGFVKEDVYENVLEMCVCTTTVRRAKKVSSSIKLRSSFTKKKKKRRRKRQKEKEKERRKKGRKNGGGKMAV